MSDLKAPFDWELLETTLNFSSSSIQPSSSLQPHPDNITISRDKDFHISTQIEGKSLKSNIDYDVRTALLGETIVGEDIIIQTNPLEKITLHKIISRGRQIRGDGFFTLKASLHKISRTVESEQPRKSFIIYALNCPELNWSSMTNRSYDGSLKMDVGGKSFSQDGMPFTFGHNSVSHRWNCVVLSNSFGKIILSQSDLKNLSHLNPCTIHFVEGDNIFNEDLQKKWIEAIGFFFGERLIKIGDSVLSEKGSALTQTSYNPYAHNLRLEISNPGLKPFDVNDDSGMAVDEARISKAIERFIENYDELKLGDSVWKMWYGRMMPLGANLTSYSSSLEALMNAWFKSKKTKSHGVYKEASDFTDEINPLLLTLKAKFATDATWLKIISHIEGANRISIADKYAKLFQELDLEFGEVEKEVISSRNKFAHGGAVDSDKANYVVKAARAYETIISRCILKAIGASDNYFDYSEYGFPLRPIKEKIRGARGTYELLP